MTSRIQCAVLPAAGLGTRFLPVTKTVPKELLPILTVPALQFGVEEALSSGIRRFIFVVSPDKPDPAAHFRPNAVYDRYLARLGKEKQLRDLNQKIKEMEVLTVEQREPLGLGHAVLSAKEAVGENPFAVILPDIVIEAAVPCLQQLLGAFEKTNCSVNATMKVSKEEISSYGVYAVGSSEGRLHEAVGVVEKPLPSAAPSDFVIVGRYLFQPEVFGILEKLPAGKGGEIQLADAMDHLAKKGRLFAYEFEGEHFDTGSPLGFLKANLHFGIKQFGREKVLG